MRAQPWPMEPHRKGELTEAIVVAELKRREIPVSKPIGNSERYDLVAESEAGLWRLQIKTGQIKDGTVRFRGTSVHTNSQGHTRRQYEDDVDYFVVYADELESLYLIPESAFETKMWLRVTKPERGDGRVNHARDYEFDRNWPPEEGVTSPTGLDDEILAALEQRGARVWLPTGTPDHVDALVAAGETLRRVRFERGWLVDGRIRFDTGDRTRPPAKDDPVDDVLVYCSELDELYAVARDEYDMTISLRVADAAKPDSRINWAEEYRFTDHWPTYADS